MVSLFGLNNMRKGQGKVIKELSSGKKVNFLGKFPIHKNVCRQTHGQKLRCVIGALVLGLRFQKTEKVQYNEVIIC